MQFYAVGNKKVKGSDGEVTFKNILIQLNETTRVGAENQANRIARRERVRLEGVYVARGTQKAGGILTKNAKNRKKNANAKLSK